jgi:lysophospholipase L1-like esterase
MANLLALGDSYTTCEEIDPADGWPAQLARALSTRGVILEPITVVARNGWSTSELAAGIEEAKVEGSYSIVTLLSGVNNQYRGLDLQEYESQFAGLTQTAIAFAGGDASRVIVLSIPDWSVTPFARDQGRTGTAEAIDRFNAMNKLVAERLGAHYIDVTGISREALNNPDLIAKDGLHPSAEMYRRWVGDMLPVVQRILDSPVALLPAN